MELEQLFSILKLVCDNNAMRNEHINDYPNQYELIISQFKHWCYTNKHDFSSIRLDIFTPNPTQSHIYQWFKHQQSIQIYNALVDVIINASQHQHQHQNQHQHQHQYQQQQNHEYNEQPQQNQYDEHQYHQHQHQHHHQYHHQVYESYSSSNNDSDDPVIEMEMEMDQKMCIDNDNDRDHIKQQTQEQEQHDDLNMNKCQIQNNNQREEKQKQSKDIVTNYLLYDDKICIENTKIYKNNSYCFQVTISSHLIVKYSLYEFILSLLELNLSTINAVWQKISKNEDDLIGDKQNLCLCIHILICISIQNKYKSNNNNNNNNDQQEEYNKFQQDAIYLKFLDCITTILCQHFVNRQLRKKLTPKCLCLRDNKSSSNIVMGFGDLVDELPKWLIKTNEILLNQQYDNEY